MESQISPGLMSNRNISIETDQWHCLSDIKKRDDCASIPSASKSIDRLFFPLFKGIPKKNITEIVGLPGTGKTCFAIHLAINALDRSPNSYVFYIDTANNFTVERFNQIYRARENVSKVPITDFLDRIIILPVADVYELFMQLTRLESISRELESDGMNPDLIIIDNVAAPFKLIPRFSMEKRIKIIEKLAKDLRKLSSRYNCVILTINQLTRKLRSANEFSSPFSTDPQYQLVPSLGQTWRNNIDSTIFFSGDDVKGRFAYMSKNNLLFEPLVDFDTICKAKQRIKYNLKEEGFIEEF